MKSGVNFKFQVKRLEMDSVGHRLHQQVLNGRRDGIERYSRSTKSRSWKGRSRMRTIRTCSSETRSPSESNWQRIGFKFVFQPRFWLGSHFVRFGSKIGVPSGGRLKRRGEKAQSWQNTACTERWYVTHSRCQKPLPRLLGMTMKDQQHHGFWVC